MAAREYKFTIETVEGEELVTYQASVQGVGRIRAISDGTLVQLVQTGDDDEDGDGEPTVLAAAVDPGTVDLVLVRDTVRGKGKPVTKKVHREPPTAPALTTEP